MTVDKNIVKVIPLHAAWPLRTNTTKDSDIHVSNLLTLVLCRAYHFSDLAATGAPWGQTDWSFAMVQQERPIGNNSVAVRRGLKAFGYNFAIDGRLLQSQVSGAAVGGSRFLARLDSFLSITQTGSTTRQYSKLTPSSSDPRNHHVVDEIVRGMT